MIAAVGRTVGRRPTAGDFEPQTWALAVIGRGLSAYDLAEAMETARLAGRHMAAFLRGHDLFLTATMAYPPVKIGAFALKPVERLQLLALRALPARLLIDKALAEIPKDIFEATGNTMLFNMTGQPAMSVPLHWNAAGLPIGVQFAGRFGEEAALFRLAAQLEQARPWFDKRPPLKPGV